MSRFHFRHFTVHQEHAALKVGTDSMLLGSLCDFTGKQRILDIGTGMGVLPLMIAQRFAPAEIVAVEIDGKAVKDAEINFRNSPFGTKLVLINENILMHSFTGKFNGIVANPPYFEDSTKNAGEEKKKARHTDSLNFSELVSFVAAHLSDDGIFWVILPFASVKNFTALCNNSRLYPRHFCTIEGKPEHPVRAALSFSFSEGDEVLQQTLTVRSASGEYTADYIALTREFHGTDLSAGKTLPQI